MPSLKPQTHLVRLFETLNYIFTTDNSNELIIESCWSTLLVGGIEFSPSDYYEKIIINVS